MTTTAVDDPRRLLHSLHRWDDERAVLRLSVDAFIGIDESGREVLGALGIHDIFDLAHAPVFGAAAVLVAASGDPDHPFHRLGRVAESLVDGRGDQLPPERWPTQPILAISGLGEVNAPRVEGAFDLRTIGDLAVWPPYVAAVEIARRAAGLAVEPVADTGTPADLLPQNGQYPTDKVYYRSLLVREFADSDRGVALETEGGLDLGRVGTGASTGVGYGALVMWEQLWYGQGLVLGNLLHSLALAPGEATMVAIVDWTRAVSASTVETVDQLEALSASTSQNRALSEVTSGVTSEIQSGFSTSATSSTTVGAGTTGGAAGSATVPLEGVLLGLGGGGGTSAGAGHTQATSMTVASTAGTRETFAEYAQQISESTQQQANSARSRRASVVQEVRESTSEQIQTRVVANYNHMHAMSVCYYEIVQIYRVVLQPSRVEKCAFVPMTALDFTDDSILDRFALYLRAVALDPIVTRVLASSVRVSLVSPVSGAVYERLPFVLEFPTASTRTAPAEGATTGDSGPFEGPFPPPVLADVTIPGPIQVSPTSTITHASATVGGEPANISVSVGGVAQSPASSDVSWPALDLESIQVSVYLPAPADEIALTLGVNTGGAEQRYRVTMSTAGGQTDGDFLRVTAVVAVGGDVSSTDLALAKAHLATYAAWYTARIWERLDTTSVSALLAQYRYQGRPLLSAIDPRVLTVTGTHVVFRLLLDDAGRRGWERELDQWGLTGPEARQEDHVPLPTGGVFAEAILGRANSAEPLDVTRFWNWQDSPPPFAPPAIAPVAAGQQDPTQAPTSGSLDPALISMVQPSRLPDPTGLASTLGLLGAAGVFRDMSFGSETIGAASAAAAVSAAAEIAAVAAAQQAFATAAGLASPTMTGALINAAKDGLPGAAERLNPPSTPSTPGSPGPSGTPGVDGGSGAGGTGGVDGVDGGSGSGTDGTDGTDGGDGSDGTGGGGPEPTPGGGPATGDDPLPTYLELGLRIEVPADSVRMSLSALAADVIPAELRSLVGTPLDMILEWTQDVGTEDGSGDVFTDAVVFLGKWGTGIGEIDIAISLLKSVVDLLGLEDLLTAETLAALQEKALEVLHLVEAVMFPLISGGTWLDYTAQVEVTAPDEDHASPHDGYSLSEFGDAGIRYGLQTTSTATAGGPWWAGTGGSFLMSSTSAITEEEITHTAASEGGDAYRLRVSGNPTIALDWTTVVRDAIPLVRQKVTEALELISTEADAALAILEALGQSAEDIGELVVGSVEQWYEWWLAAWYAPLSDFLAVELNFDFDVAVTRNTAGRWTVRTTAVHDRFPQYTLTLTKPRDDSTEPEPLYAGPFGLGSSQEGPFTLLAPPEADGEPTPRIVDEDWFDSWS